jgi:hypothetical protein
MWLLYSLVELCTCHRGGQRLRQADLRQRFGQDRRIVTAPLVVQPRTDGGIQAGEHLVTGVLGISRARPHRPPRALHQRSVLLGGALTLALLEVQVGQRHDAPVGAYRLDLRDLQEPA